MAGSFLGLDVALSDYGLRRVAIDDELHAPVLNSGDRQTLVDTVALLDPFALTDAGRDALLAALRAGRARAIAAASDPAALDALAAEAHLDGWRRQELGWLARRGRGGAAVEAVFSLAELVWLGHPPPSVDLAAWGVSAVPVTGCLCTRFPAPEDWSTYAGRPGAGLLAAEVADLTLRVTELVAELRLPASLTPSVLSVATLEFVDRVQPADQDDWRTLVTTARRLTRERIEDYIAALAVGGPLIADSDGSEREVRP